MNYDPETNTVTLSSGRTFKAYVYSFAPHPSGAIEFTGETESASLLPYCDRVEIANHMIRLWAEWVINGNGLPRVEVVTPPL